MGRKRPEKVKSKTFAIRCSEECFEVMAALAKQEKKTVSSWVVSVIEQEIANHNPITEPTQVANVCDDQSFPPVENDIAANVCGKFQPKDLIIQEKEPNTISATSIVTYQGSSQMWAKFLKSLDLGQHSLELQTLYSKKGLAAVCKRLNELIK